MSRKLYDTLRELSDRYNRLRSHFETMHKHSALLTKPDSPLRSVTIGELQQKGYFDVSFAGTTIRFLFTFRPGEPSSLKGLVVCLRLDSLTNEPVATVGQFQFDGQGDTGMKYPDNGDPVYISNDHGACYAVAYFLHEGLMTGTPTMRCSRRRGSPPPFQAFWSGAAELGRWALATSIDLPLRK